MLKDSVFRFNYDFNCFAHILTFPLYSPEMTITVLTIRCFELLPAGARREPLLKKPSEEL